jgi:multidrug resistance efflux pump
MTENLTANPEAMAARSPLTAAPHPLKTFLICLASLAAGAGVAVWIERSGEVRFDGYLHAHTTPVTAAHPGRVAVLNRKEGDRVSIGDTLLSMTDGQLLQDIETQKDEVARSEVQLQQSLAEADLELQWRTNELEQRIVDYQLRSASYLKEKYDFELEKSMLTDVLAANQTAALNDADSLFKALVVERGAPEINRMTAALKLENISNAADVSSAQVEICEQQLTRLESIKASLPANVRRKAGVDAAEASLARSKANLERIESRRSELNVDSTAVGKVGVFRVHVGDHVTPGQTLVELLDDARRHLRVEVPSSRISGLEVGQIVNIRFPGRALRTGQIERIAPQAIPTDTNSHGAESLIIVHVEQTGELWPDLPIGTRVDVTLR